MEQKRKIPAEAVELYTRFIHGEISRRDFFSGVERFAVAGLTATAIVEALMPNYALGQQVRKDDDRIKASYETFPSPDGNGYMRGYLVRPFSADSRSETPAKLPGIIVIHENRGLNPHTEDVARRFALENFMAFAPDALSSVGGYPGDDYKGGQLFSKIDPAKRTADFVNAARWLKARPDCTGKIGATGFCYGGRMANNLCRPAGRGTGGGRAVLRRRTEAGRRAKIKAAILIHHGGLDKALAEAYPAQEAELKKNKIRYEGHIYPNSVHGFFNDATPERYNRAAAQQAWTRTIEWFNQYVRGA